jgi:hypothetical protein
VGGEEVFHYGYCQALETCYGCYLMLPRVLRS